MNQKCLTTIYVPVQPLNFNINPPSICKEHEKPLSYYNKYKPDDDPICLDCLIKEAKEGKEFNLYLPFSNLEQEYYYQKNAFFQIIEQANNMKKYDAHITNFQHLLTNYFGQFISNFLKEKILVNSSTSQKNVEFSERNNFTTKDIMNILNKVENEKYILENKCADVFSQINKLQTILLKNHDFLEKSFKELLYGFFDYSKSGLTTRKENSNKKNSISIQSNSSHKSQDFLTSTKYKSKTPKDDIISQFSPINEYKGNFNDKFKDISNYTENVNLNMEKEKIFEENIEFEPEEEKKSSNSHNEINNSFKEDKFENFLENIQEKKSSIIKTENELEWRKKKCDEEPFGWRRKSDEDDDIYKIHKDKINKLIEQDKNKKSSSISQSFFRPKKSNYNKKYNLNKSFQKYNPAKFCFSKKIDYKQYNQFIQKTCRKCHSSFVTTKDEEICQNCKCISDDEDKLKKRINRDFSNKIEKFRFFPKKNFCGPKKSYIQPHPGNIKYLSKKNDTSFNRQYGNKSLVHSNSNFINRHLNNRMNSPKGYNEHRKYNNNGKYKMIKGKERHEYNFDKNNFGINKYQHNKNNDDDFEVDLESDEKEENNSIDNDENNENDMDNNDTKIDKTFFKNSKDVYHNKLIDENILDENDNLSENKNNFDDKSKDSFDKKDLSEKENNNNEEKNYIDNDNNIERENDNSGDDDSKDKAEPNDRNDDNEFEADF